MFVFDDSLRIELADQEYREAYADDYLNTYVATQIQVLREQRNLSQQELAELIGTKQPGISRLENVNHSSWKTETLKKIAHAFGVRLKISFETYGDLLKESNVFGRKALERPEFDKDPGIFPGAALDYFFVAQTTTVIAPLPEEPLGGSETTTQIKTAGGQSEAAA